MRVLATALLIAAVAIATALTAIDLRERRLPNPLVLTLGLTGLAWSLLATAAAPTLTDILVGSIAGPGLLLLLRAGYARLRHRMGLGLGDVKLVAAGACWVGASGLPMMILVGALATLAAVGIYRLWSGRAVGDLRLPFGPGLLLGLAVTLIARLT